MRNLWVQFSSLSNNHVFETDDLFEGEKGERRTEKAPYPISMSGAPDRETACERQTKKESYRQIERQRETERRTQRLREKRERDRHASTH